MQGPGLQLFVTPCSSWREVPSFPALVHGIPVGECEQVLNSAQLYCNVLSESNRSLTPVQNDAKRDDKKAKDRYMV